MRGALPSCVSAASTQLPNELRGCVPLNTTEPHTGTHTCTLTSTYRHPHPLLSAPCLLISWFARLASAADGSVCTTAPLLPCRVDNCTLDLSVGRAYYFVSLKGIHCGLSVSCQPHTHFKHCIKDI